MLTIVFSLEPVFVAPSLESANGISKKKRAYWLDVALSLAGDVSGWCPSVMVNGGEEERFVWVSIGEAVGE